MPFNPDLINQIITLLATLINPTTLVVGALISHGMEQLEWFKRDDVSGALKFLVMFLACEIAAVLLAVLSAMSIPTTLEAWRMVFLTGVAIAIGSNGFHVLIKKYTPALGDWFIKLLTALKLPTDDQSQVYLQGLMNNFLDGLSLSHPLPGTGVTGTTTTTTTVQATDKPPEPEEEKGA